MALAKEHTESKKGPITSHICGERRCLVCSEPKAKSDLIRFGISPEGAVVPDLMERLPGRGLWVSATKDALETATAKNLFSKAARQKVRVSPELPQQVERLLLKRILDLLGLAKAAGAVVARTPKVLECLGKGELQLVILSEDAGRDITKKLAHMEKLYRGPTALELGAALGRDHAVAIGLRPHPLTQKLEDELKRWRGVSPFMFVEDSGANDGR